MSYLKKKSLQYGGGKEREGVTDVVREGEGGKENQKRARKGREGESN